MIRDDTIVAIATPPGAGGIGIVRLSGHESHRMASRLFSPEGGKPRARVATLGRVVDPQGKKTLDRCLLTLFFAPNSYTGEDVAEFSCHGSGPVLRRLLQLLVEGGARPAGPGEFTMRAVLSGRIDLTQAEAVNRLVRARTLLQAETAVAQLEGEGKGAVSAIVSKIDDALLDVIARLEAAVDFAGEDEEFIGRDEAEATLGRLGRDLRGLIGGFERASLLRDGAVVVIAGAANVGKSTLFNAILKRERAIVDHRPGTTRDYIAETVDLEGLPLTLVDTAGLRGGGDEVEIEGMRRTEARLGEADAVILVAEHGRPLAAEERALLERLRRERPVILALNKSDLEGRASEKGGISISALKGDGVAELISHLKEEIGYGGPSGRDSDEELITELRQQQLFRTTAEAVDRALELLAGDAYVELVLEELNGAMSSLGEITGEKSADDVLERIFSQFCVGK